MQIDTDIHNYYEQLVFEHIELLTLRESKDGDYLVDLTCLALNQLPPRYIRHEVDMAYYLPNSERRQMQMNVIQAIQAGIDFLDTHKQSK